MTRQLRIGSGALILVFVLAGAQGCGGGSPSGPLSAPGSVRCTEVTGSIDFSPAMTDTGSAPETSTVTVHLAHCTTSGSDVTVSGGVSTSSLTGGTNSCTSLLVSRSVTVTTRWSSSKRIKPSVVEFSGFSATATASGSGGFALPGKGHMVNVEGSFAGSDDGASSYSDLFFTEPAGQVLSDCAQPSGVASLTVGSGQVALS